MLMVNNKNIKYLILLALLLLIVSGCTNNITLDTCNAKPFDTLCQMDWWLELHDQPSPPLRTHPHLNEFVDLTAVFTPDGEAIIHLINNSEYILHYWGNKPFYLEHYIMGNWYVVPHAHGGAELDMIGLLEPQAERIFYKDMLPFCYPLISGDLYRLVMRVHLLEEPNQIPHRDIFYHLALEFYLP